MRRAQGYACITEPDQATRESDTFTCGHCQFVVHVKAKARPEDIGGQCRLCMALICPNCVGKGCDPFEKKLQRMETVRSYF